MNEEAMAHWGAVAPKANKYPQLIYIFPDLPFHCSDNKTIISHNSIHISALLNNLIVNTKMTQVVKILSLTNH